MSNNPKFKTGKSYHAKHVPSGEDWHIIGIAPWRNRCCAAGWPPSEGRISDLKDIKEFKDLTDDEKSHRTNKFGTDWL